MNQVLLLFFVKLYLKFSHANQMSTFSAAHAVTGHCYTVVEVDHMWRKCDFVQSSLKDKCTIKRSTCIKSKIELLCIS